MRRSSVRIQSITDPRFDVLLVFLSVGLAFPHACGQTQQPFLFAKATTNGSPVVVTFSHNDATGALTPVPGSPFSLNTPGCAPEELDVHARYLFGRHVPGARQRHAGHFPDRRDEQCSGAPVEPAFYSAKRIRRRCHRPQSPFHRHSQFAGEPSYSPLGAVLRHFL